MSNLLIVGVIILSTIFLFICFVLCKASSIRSREEEEMFNEWDKWEQNKWEQKNEKY